MSRPSTSLTGFAVAGFSALSHSAQAVDQLNDELGISLTPSDFAGAANPDQALDYLQKLCHLDPSQLCLVLSDTESRDQLIAVLGVSAGLGEFLLRHPAELSIVRSRPELVDGDTVGARLRDSVREGQRPEQCWTQLRIAYRRSLLMIALFDVCLDDPTESVPQIAAALADLAGAALSAAVDIATRFATTDRPVPFAIIGMGKAGARELNYVSDVDVLFVVDSAGELSDEHAVRIGTELARGVISAITGICDEPPLWEVDAGLRPEGNQGPLVRTIASYGAYYRRWAKNWEFQALLKARPLAGDADLGQRFSDLAQAEVWASASRPGFVESVQRMRERVTAHIPRGELDVQLKLGAGGLRDIEFTVQLLQLVHGAGDESVRQAGTLDALQALAVHGYIGRAEAASFAADYRFLRLAEHRLQLQQLSRTHLMPRDDDDLRVLARACGMRGGAAAIRQRWSECKVSVRSLHERLFYRPLLAAVAALPDEGLALTTDQAAARLAAIGFVDSRGALGHITALSQGVSRRSQIQRTLLPVILQWLSEGADPDYGLLAFRRLSDELGESYWYLRMLRDSSGAAQRLARALSASRFIGELFQLHPEAAAWLEKDSELHPRTAGALRAEATAIVVRTPAVDSAAAALRGIRRRETLRVALAWVFGLLDDAAVGSALADLSDAWLGALLAAIRPEPDGIQFSIIALGRYGGREQSFGSDADVVFVYRAEHEQDGAHRAEYIVSELRRLTEDFRLPFILDVGLRPEGKNGPVVRSLQSYAAYYARWSLTWEAQALLRARAAAGDAALGDDFLSLADEVRYPESFADPEAREIKRVKARVESERLPQAADPTRHLKLGRGSLSDVEWLVQLIQLRYGAEHPTLRTGATLEALDAASELGILPQQDAARLRAAWLMSTRARSALTLWTNRTSDVLPRDLAQLEGTARLMGYPPGSASTLDDDYLRITRLARAVFERNFYGVEDSFEPSTP